ncbi:MAG: hypothetical protein K9G67_02705 [Bacteroidales bacterium]|nr:hypothetical protein [Bacteroidales bacterium]MCF8343769.1 hypothetical protein [Bacteroidales bacterium]MCF8351634.1 hypothetical protein [Bacteroidales bacterium]MCF8375238.1 hypothetical protein [Bacteroidales bacterium]MCF8400262.1 hypothetical protein [Bacteroidales bacterium]
MSDKSKKSWTDRSGNHYKDVNGIKWEDLPTDVIVAEQQAWLMREGSKCLS